MIGWLEIIEAEDLALDLPGSTWRAAVPPGPVGGSLSGSGTVIQESIPAPLVADGDFCIYQDLPFQVLTIVPPDWTINRNVTAFTDGAQLYKLADEEQYKSFIAKRAYLLSAFNWLATLPGYSLTKDTPAEPELKRAQLLVAESKSKTNLAYYENLKAAGVKSEQRGNASVEFFTMAELSKMDPPTHNELVGLLAKWRDDGFGGIMYPEKPAHYEWW